MPIVINTPHRGSEDLRPIIDAAAAGITALVIAMILYGSLFPFEFSSIRGDPLANLLSTWRVGTSRSDFVSNIFLYLPFGFFAVQVWCRLRIVPQIFVSVLAGAALSSVVELTQFYDVGRESAMADLYANIAGSFFGSLAGAQLGKRTSFSRLADLIKRPFVTLLLACWMGCRLYPFVPAADLHKLWTAIKPLMIAPTVRVPDVYRQTSVWIAIALLLESLFGINKSRTAVLYFFVAVILGRILIVGISSSPDEIVGGAVAILLWNAMLWRSRVRAFVVATLFSGAVIVRNLEPFRFAASSRGFRWVPFLGFIQGSMDTNIVSFLEKSFMYGALLWVLMRAGLPWVIAMAAGGSLVLFLALVQTHLPGRSAEITDAVILLLAGGTMSLMHERATE